jgi:ribonuclease HIII
MYSDQYFYFTLRPDLELSEKISIELVKSFLNSIEEIKEKTSVTYQNNEMYPWITLDLINAKSMNSWSSNKDIEDVNLISIVGSKNTLTDTFENKRKYYLTLLEKIADYLKWEIVEEETEDGIENFVVYKP